MARDLQTKAAVDEVRAYIDEPRPTKLAEGRGLWLFGDTGTGKTTLAMLISKAALEAGKQRRDLLAAETAGADPPHLRLRDRAATPTSRCSTS